MVQMYKELLPNDHFVISIPQPISMNERQLLTLFYQPMTGAQPISLYLTLWAEGEDTKPTTMNHYYLMNVLGLSVREVFEARIALEAIGLLRTYRASDEDNRTFIYELQRPLDAKTFFADPLLSMFLFSKIGEPAYRKLRSRFLQTVDKSQFKDVSRSFTDVFKPVHMRIDVDENETMKSPQQGYTFYNQYFDFNLLLAGLNEHLVPTKMLTGEVREKIAKIAFMYQLDAIQMQTIVIMSFDENMEFSFDRLRKEAADYYKITISKEPPKFEKVFRDNVVNLNDHKNSKEQSLVDYYRNISPLQFLTEKNNGKPPTEYTRKIIEDLFFIHEMDQGVLNALIDYVLLVTDGKMSKNFIESVADQWLRNGIDTVEKAIEFARQEHDKRNPKHISVEEVTYSNADVKTFLTYLYKGKKPLPFIVEIAEDLVNKYGMNSEVVNVLMEYVIENNSGRLNKKYIQAIASNWQAANVTTVEEAKKQIQEFNEEVENKRKNLFNARITLNNINSYVTNEPYEETFAYYETTPPYDFFKDLNNDREPFGSAVKIAEDLVLIYGLSIGVVNVLSEYVLNVQNGQFPKRYVESIASSWRQLNIKTAEEATNHLNEQNEVAQIKKKIGYVPKITKETLVIRNDLPQNLKAYNHLTPYEFLKYLSNGMEPLATNIQIAEDLVLKFGLKVEVVNPLIEYVFNSNNGRIAKHLIEPIAKEWQINKVSSLEMALEKLENMFNVTSFKSKVGYVPAISKEKCLILAKSLDEIIEPYDLTPPYEFLKHNMLDGVEPLSQQVKMAEEAIDKFGLSIGTINVLIEYVMNLQNMKLPRNYFMAIAQDWSLRSINITRKALEDVANAQKSYEMNRSRDKNNAFANKQYMETPGWYNERNDLPDQERDLTAFEEEKQKLLEQLSQLEEE